MKTDPPGKPEKTRVLAINSGSSSIKFALFSIGDGLKRIREGRIEGIGSNETSFRVRGASGEDLSSRALPQGDHATAIDELMEWIAESGTHGDLAAIGHRVVHGGRKYFRERIITEETIKDLKDLIPLDPAHLSDEILLLEKFARRFPDVPQVACFDTAFHHDLPAVARALPIPRRFESLGVRRYGFHGLSYSFLREELARVEPRVAAKKRVIYAHLGGGASLAAVLDGKSADTSMGFTPASGIPMGTRSGDLDPGLFYYLATAEKMSPAQINEMVNFKSGLLGLSETGSDLKELLKRESRDVRAAEAIAMFCYQIKKMIGSFAAALGGLDTLVFAGGIGENAPCIRERACEGLGFLGIELHGERNARSESVISTDAGRVTVRVIHTDEEYMIAKVSCHVLGLYWKKENQA